MINDDKLIIELSYLDGLLKDLKEVESIAVVQKLIAADVDPLQIVECCQKSMRDVGKSYETGRFYLSGLMMAGEILRQIMELIFPLLEKQINTESMARVLIGTVQGDIHDIGKDLVIMLLRCHGFEVLDLGIDVSPEEFVRQTKAFAPDIIALSALLTSAHEAMKETIQLLQSNTEGSKSFKTIIGGGFTDEFVCRNVGSDYWAKDAMSGVTYCQKIVAEK